MTAISGKGCPFPRGRTDGAAAPDEPRTPVAPVSLVETRDRDPYPAYAAARALGDVVWDEGMAAWLVLDHKGCAFVETREDLFAEFTGMLPGADRITGPHEFRLLVGEPHQRLHHYLARRWLPELSETPIARHSCGRSWRSGLPPCGPPVAPSCGPTSRRSCRSPLWAECIGLPAMDQTDLRRAKGFTDAILAWRHCYGADQAKVEAAVEASHELERAIPAHCPCPP